MFEVLNTVLLEDDRAVISPKPPKGAPPLGPDAVVALTAPELEILLDMSGAKAVVGGRSGHYRVYMAPDALGGFAISGPFFGAPHAVFGLETLVAQGARRFWVLGWCGSIQKEIRIGDLLVPTGAVSEEGTSPHYPIGATEPGPDPRMLSALMGDLTSRGLAPRAGKVWSTDAIFRETVGKLRSYRSQGILAVEMEMSALFTVAIYRRVSLGGILVVSDELSEHSWRHGFGTAELKNASKEACRAVLDLAGSCRL